MRRVRARKMREIDTEKEIEKDTKLYCILSICKGSVRELSSAISEHSAFILNFFRFFFYRAPPRWTRELAG